MYLVFSNTFSTIGRCDRKLVKEEKKKNKLLHSELGAQSLDLLKLYRNDQEKFAASQEQPLSDWTTLIFWLQNHLKQRLSLAVEKINFGITSPNKTWVILWLV